MSSGSINSLVLTNTTIIHNVLVDGYPSRASDDKPKGLVVASLSCIQRLRCSGGIDNSTDTGSVASA